MERYDVLIRQSELQQAVRAAIADARAERERAERAHREPVAAVDAGDGDGDTQKFLRDDEP
jgi:hypothetical protein